MKLRDFKNDIWLSLTFLHIPTQDLYKQPITQNSNFTDFPSQIQTQMTQIQRGVCTFLVYDTTNIHSFDYVKRFYLQSL